MGFNPNKKSTSQRDSEIMKHFSAVTESGFFCGYPL
jgi:hypothetical protein